MANTSAFRGSIRVRSTPDGYVVSFQCETDAHDLGHALAAIITTYLDRVRKVRPESDTDALRETVLEGIQCGMEHNPVPLVQRRH